MRLGPNNHPVDDNSSSSRAEDLRRRRTQRSQQRVNTATHRITNPVNPRPVIVRGHARQGYSWENTPNKVSPRKAPIKNTPLYSKSSNRGGRQFYLTMDRYPGTEMRLPAIPVFRPGWRLFSGFIAIAMLVGIYSLMNSAYFQVSSVEVQGLKRISAQEVNETLKLQEESIINVDGSTLREALVSKYPELTQVQVSVSLPNYVTVSAVERTPVMAIQKGDSVQWVDSEGVIFPQRGDAGALLTIHTEDDLPLAAAPLDAKAATADAANPSVDPAQLVTAGLSAAPAAKTAPAPQKIDPILISAAQALSQKIPPDSTLVYNKLNGLGWTDQQGTQVFIGKDMSDYDAKVVLYQQIAQYLTDQGQKATLIDVENVSAPFYRVEQQSNGG